MPTRWGAAMLLVIAALAGAVPGPALALPPIEEQGGIFWLNLRKAEDTPEAACRRFMAPLPHGGHFIVPVPDRPAPRTIRTCADAVAWTTGRETGVEMRGSARDWNPQRSRPRYWRPYNRFHTACRSYGYACQAREAARSGITALPEGGGAERGLPAYPAMLLALHDPEVFCRAADQGWREQSIADVIHARGIERHACGYYPGPPLSCRAYWLNGQSLKRNLVVRTLADMTGDGVQDLALEVSDLGNEAFTIGELAILTRTAPGHGLMRIVNLEAIAARLDAKCLKK